MPKNGTGGEGLGGGGTEIIPQKESIKEKVFRTNIIFPQKNKFFTFLLGICWIPYTCPPTFFEEAHVEEGRGGKVIFFRTRFRTTKIGPDFAFSLLKKKYLLAGKRDYRCLKKAAAGTIVYFKRRMGKGNILRPNLLWESWVCTLFSSEKYISSSVFSRVWISRNCPFFRPLVCVV